MDRLALCSLKARTERRRSSECRSLLIHLNSANSGPCEQVHFLPIHWTNNRDVDSSAIMFLALPAVHRKLFGTSTKEHRSHVLIRTLVQRFIKMFTYQGVEMSSFFQRCTTGAALISAMPSRILCLSSAFDLTRIWRRKVCAILPKRVSTKLSHDPCLGVWT